MNVFLVELRKASLPVKNGMYSSKCSHLYYVKYNLNQCLGQRQRYKNCSGIVQFQGVTNTELVKDNNNSTSSSQESL